MYNVNNVITIFREQYFGIQSDWRKWVHVVIATIVKSLSNAWKWSTGCSVLTEEYVYSSFSTNLKQKLKPTITMNENSALPCKGLCTTVVWDSRQHADFGPIIEQLC